jgi:diguanylate cyclase (GGDEF)-like protein
MDDLELILERLKDNEDIARKFHQVEAKILSILNFRDFLEVLLYEIRTTFNVPRVWISLIETSDISKLIRSLESSDLVREHINLIGRASFESLVGHRGKPLLVNSDVSPYAALFPPEQTYAAGSMAIVPISLDGEWIGSLNHADVSKTRFEPGMDTRLLEQLAVKVSLCLSNVAAHERLSFLAFHDSLTGLLNRRVMENVLSREVARSTRYQSPISIVFVDLDDFKQVNDTHGHGIGDALLKYVATILKKMSRDSDVVARFAGDEFVLILPETIAENAEKLIRRTQDYLQNHPFVAGGVAIPVSISFGVSATDQSDASTPEQLLKIADQKLYKAKKEKQRDRPNVS